VNYPKSVNSLSLNELLSSSSAPAVVSSTPTPNACLDPLEGALRQFLQVYQSIPVEERPLKLKCLSSKYEPALIEEIGGVLSEKNSNNILPNLEINEKGIPVNNLEKKFVETILPVKVDWNVLDFFTNSTLSDESAGGVLMAEKDMELWSSTLQDFFGF